jgi:hypothetical protein
MWFSDRVCIDHIADLRAISPESQVNVYILKEIRNATPLNTKMQLNCSKRHWNQ